MYESVQFNMASSLSPANLRDDMRAHPAYLGDSAALSTKISEEGTSLNSRSFQLFKNHTVSNLRLFIFLTDGKVKMTRIYFSKFSKYGVNLICEPWYSDK
jgi:hypothetical protein